MAWLRLDDGFTDHRKVVALKTDQRRWTWLRILIYTARYRSPEVPAGIRDVIAEATPKFLSELVDIGLLDKGANNSLTVHDWHDYQPKDPTKAERQARWRAKNAESVDGDVDGAVDAPVDGDVDASRVGARARPVPSRTPTREDQSSGPALPAVELQALPNYEGHEYKLWKRLCVAAGVASKPTEIAKLENVVKAHRSTERELVMAIEAATGPGVNDPLAVALAELKNLALERKRGAA